MQTPDAVIDHLLACLPDFEATAPPFRLHGGRMNQVWRVPGRPVPVVVKAVPPFIEAQPWVALSPARGRIEADLLQLLGPGGTLSALSHYTIRAPLLLDYDPAGHVMVMEDLGRLPDLGTWLREPVATLAAADIGAALGFFIGALHARSYGDVRLAQQFDNQAIQQGRQVLQYEAVEGLAWQAGLADAAALGRQATALGLQLLQPGQCLIMGDLWPSSVLVGDYYLRLIDWELAHFGRPAQDVGQLVAHLWMHAHRAPASAPADRAEDILRNFMRAYRIALGATAEVLVDADMLRACAVHFGAEVLACCMGSFQRSSLYEGLPVTAPAVQEAVAVAALHLRHPEGTSTFNILRP